MNRIARYLATLVMACGFAIALVDPAPRSRLLVCFWCVLWFAQGCLVGADSTDSRNGEQKP